MQPLKLTPIRQRFPADRLADPAAAVRGQLAALDLDLAPGSRVALAVGSRGIAHVAAMVRATADHVRERGATPFIVPAMGSHGGATAEGQTEVLRTYGVTREAVGAEVCSSMEVVRLPADDLPVGVFMDRVAWESDGVILLNRVKPHTDYHDTYASGLVKMAVIGLGKHRQALDIHRHGVYGLRRLIPRCAEVVLDSGKILAGIAVVENAYDQPCSIEALPADEIMQREPALLEQASERMPSLPVDELDILIVDRLGKDISGVGLDTNIIGRMMIDGEPEPETPRIAMIIVRDLTEASHGNACGMGLADLMLRQACEKIDFAATNENIFTSGFLARGKRPLVVDNDEQALQYALRGSRVTDPQSARVIRIRDTLRLGELYVSEATLAEAASASGVEQVGPAVDLLGSEGSLPPWDFPGA